MSDPLDHVRFTRVRVEDATRQLDIARAARDEAIRRVHDEGLPLVRIAEAAGLTRRAVYDSLARTTNAVPTNPNAHTPK